MASQFISNAYAATRRHDRFLEQSANVVIVILAQFVNFVLLIAGLASSWGLYTVLLFVLLVCIYDITRYALAHYGAPNDNRALRCTGSGGEPTTHLHAPPTHNEIRVFVAIWLVWWAVSQFFYEAGVQVSFSWVLLPLLFLCVLAVSVAPQSAAPDVFALLFVVALALPSPEWMPQYMAWTRDALRVFAYFVAVFVADFFVERATLSEQAVLDCARPEILTRRTSHDNDDASTSTSAESFSQTSIYFCVTAERYEATCTAEQRRTKAIIALSAWVLVVPKLMLLLFTIGLLVAHGLLYWQRRRSAASKPVPPPPQPQIAMHVDIEAPAPLDDDDDDAETSASASEEPPPPPPPVQKKYQPPPPPTEAPKRPPPPTAIRGGVRTNTITINRKN